MSDLSLALLTDLYQLSMAYGYWQRGLHERRAVFQMNFRKLPFNGGYAIAAGLEPLLEYLEQLRFSPGDLAYLATLQGNDGKPLFSQGFLDYLGALRFTCDIDAIPEGRLVYPHEALIRVTGPLLQAQLIETALLCIVNFQTLIATKAARVCEAARGDTVLEFGLRRAQGIDGGLAASRAAYVGGCDGTSNVLAGRRFGIPVKGTHAHSWVMVFESELEAFMTYAETLPNNSVFLVDTYDTIEGVKNAIKAGNHLRSKGFELGGIRLDSGDLAELSIAARSLLDEAGFPHASIVASNDLSEQIIESLKHQGAEINVWGVGTKLVTAYDQPALGGVYKIAALEKEGGTWDFKIKLSEQPAKVSIPGLLQVHRLSRDGSPVADVIFDESQESPNPKDSQLTLIDPMDATYRRSFRGLDVEQLMVPVLREGKRVRAPDSLEAIRTRAKAELTSLPVNMRRFLNPHRYPVGLEASLWERRNAHILAARPHHESEQS